MQKNNNKPIVLRIIARLNIGGPAIHTVLLTKELEQNYITYLVTGKIGDEEGNMDYFAEKHGIQPSYLRFLARKINIIKDFLVLLQILKLIIKVKPDIIHTHTAKAGFLGRIAGIIVNCIIKIPILKYITGKAKPIKLVHTFHGHVFSGYFSSVTTTLFLVLERVLARFTDIIISLSESQKHELLNIYKIGTAQKYRIIRLGFYLRKFDDVNNHKNGLYKDIGIDNETKLIGIVGRLVPIKNHKLFVKIAEKFFETNPNINVKFVIIGGGEMEEPIIKQIKETGLEDRVIMAGWKTNLLPVYADLDIVVLTSLNEGTPVTLIESIYCRCPVVSTNVGGIDSILNDGPLPQKIVNNKYLVCKRGILFKSNDHIGGTNALIELINNSELYYSLASEQNKQWIMQNFNYSRLAAEIEGLYKELLLINKHSLFFKKR